MSPQPASTDSREIAWPSVITVISAAILIGAEVFGAAFAGGWALAVLFDLDDTSTLTRSCTTWRAARETAAAQALKRSRVSGES